MPINAISFYFLPAYVSSCKVFMSNATAKLQWWMDLDQELSNYIMKSTGVILDRVFMVSTHPHDVAPNKDEFNVNRHQLSNILDIRYLRSDNQETQNGRDVFIPYAVDASKHISSFEMTLTAREKFLFALCNEKYDEGVRLWRSKAYQLLKNHSLLLSEPHSNSSNSIVERSLSPADFTKALTHSDFCLILPGDTSSTGKLYKALFSGCIPVIFLSYRQQLPFQSFINWSAFSLVVLKEVINSPVKMTLLLQELLAIRSDPHR
jgi:hypothetical protein